ncbi:hypothetical protein [Candidatus Cardinium hertigii]|uniref:NADPH-dependent FMN reductase-like domain-containing protein n=1 Tax=Candidatus Cardinium hertigii TaxID=247481 RepID=A0A2Z3L7P8_9BACT|nr:hypothetical protein [Candidatus Cardinium hertigii]AWN81577.1 hypothetical protein DK880_00245 [Candidatus Cardinium hertigii]
MERKALILTVTVADYRFPENFSCWCAGTLEAKGVPTVLEILEIPKEAMSHESLQLQAAQLNRLEELLLLSDLLLLILPSHQNMLPTALAPSIQLLASKKHYKKCKLITIGMDVTKKSNEIDYDLAFNYSSDQLYKQLGPIRCTAPTQIQDSPTGDMCPLFAASYDSLCSLIQQILDMGSTECTTKV